MKKDSVNLMKHPDGHFLMSWVKVTRDNRVFEVRTDELLTEKEDKAITKAHTGVLPAHIRTNSDYKKHILSVVEPIINKYSLAQIEAAVESEKKNRFF